MTNFLQQIQHMPNSMFWILFGMLFITGIFFLRNTFRQIKKDHYLSTIPRSPIGAAPQGYVELSGIIKPLLKEIISPLSGKSCCYYHYKIERKQVTYDSQKNRQTKWVLEKEGSSQDWFILSDQTGQCIVAPTGAEVFTATKEQWYSDGLPDELNLNPAIKTGVAFLLGNDFRLTEARLLSGESLTALGMLNTTALSETKLSPEQLKTLEPNQTINLISGTNINHRPYILSSQPLKKVLHNLVFSAIGLGLGGIAFLALAVLGILARYGYLTGGT